MQTAVSQRASSIDRQVAPSVIGGMRIVAGLVWLANLHWKVPTDFGEDSGGGLYKYSASAVDNAPFAPFRWVTEEIILPNFQLFGWVTLVVESVLAGLLLIGYRTKLVALAGAAMTVPILLSVIYYEAADEWSWAYLMMIALHLLLYATDAGKHIGIDGLLERGTDTARRGLVVIGAVTTIVGLGGLFVARSIDFAGSDVALLGSDTGFVNSDGQLVRRAELKFLFFNPLWAILTIALGIVLLLTVRWSAAALAAAAGLAAMVIAAFVVQSYDYVRDDGGIQTIGTGQNVAFWGGMAVAAALLGRRLLRSGVSGRA